MGGWDVLLCGEKLAVGRMSTEGVEIRGKVWTDDAAGVRVQIEVVGVVEIDEPTAISEFKGSRKTHISGCGQLQDGVNARVEINKRRVI